MKLFRIFIAIVYLYTALLPVHALAMHGGGSESTEGVLEINTESPHDDSHAHVAEDPTHDTHGSMELCINQSYGTLLESSMTITDFIWHAKYILLVDTSSETISLLPYRLSGVDPGGGQGVAFNAFIEGHFGEIILHC